MWNAQQILERLEKTENILDRWNILTDAYQEARDDFIASASRAVGSDISDVITELVKDYITRETLSPAPQPEAPFRVTGSINLGDIDPKATKRRRLKGFVCRCGYMTIDVNQFRGHVMTESRKEPGKHGAYKE
jgi:hypothetical protein